MTDAEAVELIFAPGFSTASSVTDISGRGVGMDIVRTNVERLGGSVEVQSRLGEGSRFFLRLPLTLAIVQALLVRVGGGIYALPISSVTETLRVPVAEIQQLQQQEAILLRGRVLPIVRCANLFHCDVRGARGRPRHPGRRRQGWRAPDRPGRRSPARRAGSRHQVAGRPDRRCSGLSSAAILGDGSVALIVDVPALVQRLATDRSDWRWSDARDADEPARALAHSA